MSTHAWRVATVYIQSDHDFRAVLWTWGQGGFGDSIVMFLSDMSSIIISQLLLLLFKTKERMAWEFQRADHLCSTEPLTQGASSGVSS